MQALFWLSFFFSSPPQHTCATNGTPLFEIRERSETSSAITTKKIYASGAWTIDGGVRDRGCFAKSELRAIRRAVQRATWRVTTSPIACFAYSPEYTEYLLNGRLRYTHRMCSGKTADEATLDAIAFVEGSLADELPLHDPPPVDAPPPPVTKPPVGLPPPTKPPVAACSAHGTPLFEIRKRSDMAEPTSSIAIYNSGAWTFQAIEKDGSLGALSTGCLRKATTEIVRKTIHAAPWDVTFSRIVCRAYSPTFTEYYVHGNYEYTARLCGAQRIDDESAKAIKLVESELANVLPKHALVY